MSGVTKAIKQIDEMINNNRDIQVEKEQGLDDISSLNDWPEDYLQFLSYSNGLYVGEYYDCMFYSLNEVIALSSTEREMQRHLCPDSLVPIAHYYGDTIYIDCKDSRGTVYYSLEGIDDPVSFNMSFSEFLQKCIDCKFQVFWDN